MSRGTVARELTGDMVTEHAMTQAALTANTTHKSGPILTGSSWLRRLLRGDLAPAALVVCAIALLGFYTALNNDRYASAGSFNSLLTLFAVLAFAAMAQQMIMITGGIDLSVGPLMTFVLVVGSFVLLPDSSPLVLLLGFLLLLGICCFVGFLNWFPSLFGIPSFLVTLVTFTALSGFSLLLRPTYGGSFAPGILTFLRSSIGWLPWAAVAAVVCALGLEIVLRRTPWGAQLRAIGSGEKAAHDVGIRVRWIRLSAHLAAGALVFVAGMLLIAQIGSGDATVGSNYTLAGITAAILGGASIFGGRGAFIGALAGALLIQQINTSTIFLGIEIAWQYFLLGGLTLIAAGFYSKVRGGRNHG
jgi:ribose transport system ATP-binding protein